MKGVYLVFLKLEEETEIEIGALGALKFEEGLYVYTGSGRKSLVSRVKRHFRDLENFHWHIDYLSSEAEAFDNFLLPESSKYECFMADALESLCEPVDSFGSSDCDCSSHLFRVPEDF